MAYCSECGKKIAKNATFCASCGTKVGGEKVVEKKEEVKEEKVQEKTQPTPPASGSGLGGCGVAAIIVAILIVLMAIGGFFVLAFVGSKGQPGTIIKPTSTASAPAIKIPQNLKATESNNTINLAWKNSDTKGVKNYNVYKSVKNGKDYTKLTTLEPNNLNYTDTNIKQGITYYYVVTAQSTEGAESGNSNQAYASITPAPIIPQGVTSWKNVLDKYNADQKYANVLTTVTGLSKLDIEKYVSMEAKGKKMTTTLKKGTIITNTTENYKIIPNYILPIDKEFLVDDKGVPHIMMWCGNPIKLINKMTTTGQIVQNIQNITVNIINVFPPAITNVFIFAAQPLNTFVVGVLPNTFGPTVIDPDATDTEDNWPEGEILIDYVDDLFPEGPNGDMDGSKTPLEAGQQWAVDGKILLEANPHDPGPGENVTMTIQIFPAEAGVTIEYNVSGTDGYADSGSPTTNAEGKIEFNIPGGAEGITDTINVSVPSKSLSGSTSYSF